MVQPVFQVAMTLRVCLVSNFHAMLDLLPLFVSTLLYSLSATVLVLFWQRQLADFFTFLILMSSFSAIGSVVGFFAGLSRAGVAGGVLPASLVFLGAGTAYIYTLDEIKKAVVSGAGILAFTFAVATQYYYSISLRSENELLSEITASRESELEAIRQQCLLFILNPDFVSLGSLEKLRARTYCKPYIPFLE